MFFRSPFVNNHILFLQKLIVCGLAILLLPIQVIHAQLHNKTGLKIRDTNGTGFFPLVAANAVTPILVDTADAEVVTIASNAVAHDIELITDKRPKIINSINKEKYIVIAGTISHS